MKLTLEALKKIIKEEIQNLIPEQEYYEVEALSENEEYCPVCASLEEKKKKACKPSKGKRFAKRVDGKCRSFGQSGQAKSGGDRIRPGTKKGDAYCANTLSRKKWKCRGTKSVAESLKLTESQLYRMVKEELIKEFTLTGIDVPRIVSLRRPIKKRSKAKEPIQRIETDLHATQDTVDRLEEFTREIYNMLIKIIRKNK